MFKKEVMPWGLPRAAREYFLKKTANELTKIGKLIRMMCDNERALQVQI
jgi:hypothetical protein